jgi:hypothetical protein
MVLKDAQVVITIVGLVFVDVMDDGTFRESVPDSTLCDKNMFKDSVPTVSVWMTGHSPTRVSALLHIRSMYLPNASNYTHVPPFISSTKHASALSCLSALSAAR